MNGGGLPGRLLRAAAGLVLVLLAHTAHAQLGQLKPVRQPAPALELKDPAGRLHRLAEYRGQVVVVNFWATWCAPCMEEMPSLERLRAKLQGERLAILAVNVGEGEAAIERFLAKLPVGFTILLDRDRGVTRSWKAGILPATAILDVRSSVRYVASGAIDWDDPKIESLLRKLLPPPNPSIQGEEKR